MATINSSSITDLRPNVAGRNRVVTGIITTFDTAATAEDTVFTGLAVCYHVDAKWQSSAATSVHLASLNAWPSTVTAGGFVLKNASTHANFPVVFRAEGR